MLQKGGLALALPYKISIRYILGQFKKFIIRANQLIQFFDGDEMNSTVGQRFYIVVGRPSGQKAGIRAYNIIIEIEIVIELLVCVPNIRPQRAFSDKSDKIAN